MRRNDLCLLIGRGNPPLGAAIAKALSLNPVNCEIIDLPDSDIYLNVVDSLRGCHVVVVQPVCRPTPKNLVELALLIDALNRASVQEITCLIPYLGYARQDRITADHNPISSAWAVRMLKSSADIPVRLAVLDLHSLQTQGAVRGPFEILSSFPVVVPDVKANYGSQTKLAIASADVGGGNRARKLASILSAELLRPVEIIIVNKERDDKNRPGVKEIIGDPDGYFVIIVDDIVDTAGSLTNAAKSLKGRGAVGVSAYCTHGILSDPALEFIRDSVLQELVVTDSVPLRGDARQVLGEERIRVLPLGAYLAKVIMAIHKGEPTKAIRMPY